MNKATLPPGKYYIGDPCYAFKEATWSAVLSETDFFMKEKQTIKGMPVFGGSTAYGDGTYLGSDGFDYPVDAGLLAAIPVELIEDLDVDLVRGTGSSSAAFHVGQSPSGALRSVTLGTIIDAPNGLECSNDNGAFTFGSIYIDTAQDLDEEDDDENDENEGEESYFD